MPFSSVEAVVQNAFYKLDWAEHPELFTPAAILCIIIGVIGNMCFCFFFANSSTRIYKSRDALYFRRMSLFDMLVCVIVLPYSIFYESRLVNNRAVCKVMEFIRHVIIYTSHLILAAYSFELPRRVSYADVQVNVNRMMLCNFALACVFSLPALFLFDVDKVYNFKDAPTVTKTTCHLIVSFHNDSDVHGSVSLLRVHYYAVMCLCYAVALVLFIFKAMHYCEYLTLLGRRSVNVQLMDRAQTRQLKMLKNGPWRHRVRRHSQTGRPIVFAEYTVRTSDDLTTEASAETSNVYQPVVSHSHAEQSAVVEDRNIPNRSSSIQEDAEEVSSSLGQTVVNKSDVLKHQRRDSLTLENALRLKSRSESNLSIHLAQSISRELPAASQFSVNSKTSSVSKKKWAFNVMKSASNASVPKINCLFRWLDSENSTKASILKRKSSKGHLRVESYKQQLISLIVLDFIFILTAVVTFLILGEYGVVLNLIHTKCIISFYLVSLAHPGLRMVVRRHIIYYCLKTIKTKDEVINTGTEDS